MGFIQIDSEGSLDLFDFNVSEVSPMTGMITEDFNGQDIEYVIKKLADEGLSVVGVKLRKKCTVFRFEGEGAIGSVIAY